MQTDPQQVPLQFDALHTPPSTSSSPPSAKLASDSASPPEDAPPPDDELLLEDEPPPDDELLPEELLPDDDPPPDDELPPDDDPPSVDASRTVPSPPPASELSTVASPPSWPLPLLELPLLLPAPLLLLEPPLLPLLLLRPPLLLSVVPSGAPSAPPSPGMAPSPPLFDPQATTQLAPPHPSTTNAIRVFRFIVPTWLTYARTMTRANEVQDGLAAALLPLCDLAIHVASWSLLRARCSPLTTHNVLCRAGAWLPAIDSPEAARAVARSLIRHGTCLSRSLTLAARAPSADVVIGVSPRPGAPLHAHAWIEMNGAPIDPADVSGEEIARLRGPRSATSGVRNRG